MTSPLTVRWKSVTSSGRSSTSTIIRWHSGLLVVIELAMDCSTIVLPAFGGLTIRPRWPLPIGAAMSMTRPIRLFDSVSRRSRSLACSGHELLELDPVLRRLRVGSVDGVDADHRVELLLALALTGLAHLADDRVAAAESELPDHGQREVDVVGAGKVAAGADERVVVEHVEDAGRGHEDVVLEDRGVGLVAAAAALDGSAPAVVAVLIAAALAVAVSATATAVAAAAVRLVVSVRGLAVLAVPVLAVPVLVPVAGSGCRGSGCHGSGRRGSGYGRPGCRGSAVAVLATVALGVAVLAVAVLATVTLGVAVAATLVVAVPVLSRLRSRVLRLWLSPPSD